MKDGDELRPIDLARAVGLSVQAIRLLIAGYGWQNALQIMRQVHQGQLDRAFTEIDAYHAQLHARRQHAEATLAALRATAAERPDVQRLLVREQAQTIGAAAKSVGVRISALRFWETQGVLQPRRDSSSGYRFYDADQLQALRVVALLRGAGYGFESIRDVLAELESGSPEGAIVAAEQRLAELSRLSRCCVEALALFWAYVGESSSPYQ
jgi:DNA-binding transcriptional MerR regulator